MVRFDAREPGTPAAVWRGASALADAPPLELADASALLVVGAHPDDETLGAGGLLAAAADLGMEVVVVIATDGAATASADPGIAATRSAELLTAVRRLAPAALVVELGFPDGRTDEHRAELAATLAPWIDALPPDGIVAAPWRGDGHRDHRVVGEAVAGLVGGRPLLEYPIWMWHWATPGHADVPWDALVRLEVDRERKAEAVAAHASQVRGPDPLLGPELLEHVTSGAEFFVTAPPPLDAGALEAFHARHDDPWGIEHRWYERRKRAVLLASLPSERFGRALELGCGTGVLSDELATRCDELIAIDVAPTAVARARARLGDRADVRQGDVVDGLPAGPFDLVVLSEIGYYLVERDLDVLLARARAALAERGVLVAVHWRHPVAQHRMTGDAVHARVRALGLTPMVSHTEADFVLEVLARGRDSVATSEGLT